MGTDTRSYSLPGEIVEFLDALPNRERSKFVSTHLGRAVAHQKKLAAVKKLRRYPRIKGSSGESTVETLRKIRAEATDRSVMRKK